MKISSYKNSINLSKVDFEKITTDNITSRIIDEFHKHKIFTETTNNTIVYTNKLKLTTDTGQNKLELVSPLKSGVVTVEKMSDKSINISYSVSLRNQLILSVFASLLMWGIMFSDGAVEFRIFLIPIKIFILLYGSLFLQNKIKLDRIISKVIKSFKHN